MKRADTHRGLENHEEMGVVVRVDGLAAVAKVLCAVYAAEPLAYDADHAAVADRGLMQETLEVLCGRSDER